jgi:ribA/ribD-fused uncharacterized protein
MAIEFYLTKDEFGGFSNFSAHPFSLDGHRWPTSEHYFQAQKFAGTAQFDAIRKANSPAIAARLGRSREFKLRRDWESVKDDIMRRAVRAKFEAHPELRDLLLGTGEEKIVEKTTTDTYWGCASDGTGKNRLGQVLMELRAALHAAAGTTEGQRII